MPRKLIPIPILVLIALAIAPCAQAMRCGNRLVTNGDREFQVSDRCGAPFWTDRYRTVEVIGAYGPIEQQNSIDFDVWYYNFGPRQFMRRLVFREGRLVHEDTLGYGFNEIGNDCDPNRLLGGLSAGELIARCGEPASRRDDSDIIVWRPSLGIEQWRDQRREEWVYDFGDNRMLRVVRLVDGQVTGVELVPR